jgi:hypothetical protein
METSTESLGVVSEDDEEAEERHLAILMKQNAELLYQVGLANKRSLDDSEEAIKVHIGSKTRELKNAQKKEKQYNKANAHLKKKLEDLGSSDRAEALQKAVHEKQRRIRELLKENRSLGNVQRAQTSKIKKHEAMKDELPERLGKLQEEVRVVRDKLMRQMQREEEYETNMKKQQGRLVEYAEQKKKLEGQLHASGSEEHEERGGGNNGAQERDLEVVLLQAKLREQAKTHKQAVVLTDRKTRAAEHQVEESGKELEKVEQQLQRKEKEVKLLSLHARRQKQGGHSGHPGNTQQAPARPAAPATTAQRERNQSDRRQKRNESFQNKQGGAATRIQANARGRASRQTQGQQQRQQMVQQEEVCGSSSKSEARRRSKRLSRELTSVEQEVEAAEGQLEESQKQRETLERDYKAQMEKVRKTSDQEQQLAKVYGSDEGGENAAATMIQSKRRQQEAAKEVAVLRAERLDGVTEAVDASLNAAVKAAAKEEVEVVDEEEKEAENVKDGDSDRPEPERG